MCAQSWASSSLCTPRKSTSHQCVRVVLLLGRQTPLRMCGGGCEYLCWRYFDFLSVYQWFQNALSNVEKGSAHYAVLRKVGSFQRKVFTQFPIFARRIDAFAHLSGLRFPPQGAVSCREQLHEVESLMQHIAVASHSAQQTFPGRSGEQSVL